MKLMFYVLLLLFDIKNNFDIELMSKWVSYCIYDRVQKPLYIEVDPDSFPLHLEHGHLTSCVILLTLNSTTF